MFLVLALVTLASPARAGDDFAAMKKERIGGLGIGTPAAALLKALGQPSKKGKVVHQGADGNFVQTWTFATQGVEVGMTSGKRGGAQTIDSITLKGPSTLKTARGIGVGSTLADLARAYGAEKNAEESNAEAFVVGSIYGGVIFRLAKEKVTEIFLGAAAE
jgi:ribose 5-phosphate isomerase